MTAPARPPLDAREPADEARVAAYLGRLEGALREFDAAGAALAAAGRAADAAAMTAAADRHARSLAALRGLAADRAALLSDAGTATIADLAAGFPRLVSRVESLRESARESRTLLWPRFVSARRSAAACGEVLDLIARGGTRSATYGGGAAAGGALLDLAG